MIRNHWNFVMHYLAKKLPELCSPGSISALLGPGQKFEEFLAYQITTRSSSGRNMAPSVMPKAS